MSRSNLIVGLDIGTTKACAVVGEVTEGKVNILGVGTHPCHGLRKGVVNNIESTCASIERALEQAEERSGCEIKSVYVGITGWQIKSLMSHGVAALRDGAVGKHDLERVMEAANAVVIPSDREVLHVLPCAYRVDGQVLNEPLGRQGVRFEVNCHVVTSASASVDNVIECCNLSGLNVEAVVFEPLASSRSVLADDKGAGAVAMLDIGGGTSDMILFENGSVYHSLVIPLGGNHLTSDIAQVLKIPMKPTAENLKLAHGVALRELADGREIEVPIEGEREPRRISQAVLADIIEHRMEEMLRLVRTELQNAGFGERSDSEVILTGGCAMLAGIERLAERVFNLPVRIGVPRGFGGKVKDVDSPLYATGVGLVLYGAQNHGTPSRFALRQSVSIENVVSRVRSWFAGFL